MGKVFQYRLWPNHEAGDEIGMLYEKIDPILHCLTELKLSINEICSQLNVGTTNVKNLKKMMEKSKHKRILPKICEISKCD